MHPMYPVYADNQRAKGKPLLRLSAGTSVHMFEFGTEADRDAMVERYSKVRQGVANVNKV